MLLSEVKNILGLGIKGTATLRPKHYVAGVCSGVEVEL